METFIDASGSRRENIQSCSRVKREGDGNADPVSSITVPQLMRKYTCLINLTLGKLLVNRFWAAL